jgi:hypothetical protein
MPTLFVEEKRPQEKWFSALVASVCVCCDLCAQTHTFTRWTFLYVYIISARWTHTMLSAQHTRRRGARGEQSQSAGQTRFTVSGERKQIYKIMI